MARRRKGFLTSTGWTRYATWMSSMPRSTQDRNSSHPICEANRSVASFTSITTTPAVSPWWTTEPSPARRPRPVRSHRHCRRRLCSRGAAGPGVVDFLVYGLRDSSARGVAKASEPTPGLRKPGIVSIKSSGSRGSRFGYTIGSGDNNPKDGTHGTFFKSCPHRASMRFFHSST